MRDIKLSGECNLCGACCLGINGERCEHLQLLTAVGMPSGTRCDIYQKRYDGMPIVMVAKDGSRISGQYQCALNSPAETQAIVGCIGRGLCSMTIDPA